MANPAMKAALTARAAGDSSILFWSEQGETCCALHAPYPGTDTWRWERWRLMTEAETREWTRQLGHAPKCEVCRQEARTMDGTEKTTKKQETAKAEAPAKAKKTAKVKAAKETKPKKEKAPKEPQVVFAFRLSEDQRDAIHKAAGPGKATRFVRTAALAAASGDRPAFEELLAITKTNLK